MKDQAIILMLKIQTVHGLRLDFQPFGLLIHNTIVYTARRMQNPILRYMLLTYLRNLGQHLPHVIEIPELLENNDMVSKL
jgi:hypothetical protein